MLSYLHFKNILYIFSICLHTSLPPAAVQVDHAAVHPSPHGHAVALLLRARELLLLPELGGAVGGVALVLHASKAAVAL